MKKISNKPTMLIENVFDDCVMSYRDPNVQIHYNSVRTLVISSSIALDVNFTNQNAHSMLQQTTIGTIPVTKDDMSKLYDDKLVKSAKGKPYYNALKLLADNDICPNCGVRQVKTLDHFMPKSIYPQFAITPINLYPCCRDCNTEKQNPIYTSYANTLINPYYDDYNLFEWLSADLHTTSPELIFKFCVNPPLSWTTIDINKVKNHCNTFKLFDLFAYEAIKEFTNIKNFITDFKKNHNLNGLRKYFHDMYLSNRNNDLNGYKTAMYKCLMNNHNTIYNLL